MDYVYWSRMHKPYRLSKLLWEQREILDIKRLFGHCYTLYFLLRAVQCWICFPRHCGASTMFICHVPFTILVYLHLFLWNALNVNRFSIKISRREFYMIYCDCNAQKTWRNPDFPIHGFIHCSTRAKMDLFNGYLSKSYTAWVQTLTVIY